MPGVSGPSALRQLLTACVICLGDNHVQLPSFNNQPNMDQLTLVKSLLRKALLHDHPELNAKPMDDIFADRVNP